MKKKNVPIASTHLAARHGPSSSASRPVPGHEQIAARAREIWLERGQPAGHDLANWLAAEKELSRSTRFADAGRLPTDASALSADERLTSEVEKRLGSLEKRSSARSARSPTSL